MLFFFIGSSTLALISLYSEALFTGCSCTARIFEIYCCCDANSSLSCSISLEASLLSSTEPVVGCLVLDASLVNKTLKLLHFLALVGLSRQVSHVRLNNLVSLMARYSEQSIFFSVNGYYPSLENILQS